MLESIPIMVISSSASAAIRSTRMAAGARAMGTTAMTTGTTGTGKRIPAGPS